jgi:anti-sigma B factor antagonist
MQGKMSQSEDAFREADMKMTASTRLVGGVTIVDLSGRIVAGDGSAALRDLTRNLISEGKKRSY